MWQSAWLWPVPADVLAANRGRIGPACRQQRQSWSSACSCEVLVRQYVAKHISSALNHIWPCTDLKSAALKLITETVIMLQTYPSAAITQFRTCDAVQVRRYTQRYLPLDINPASGIAAGYKLGPSISIGGCGLFDEALAVHSGFIQPRQAVILSHFAN